MRGFGYDIEYGIRRAMLETISGCVSGLLLNYLFWTLENMSSSFTIFASSIKLIKDLVNLIVVIMSLADVLHTMERMKYWSTGYLIGFILFEAAMGSLSDASNLMLIAFGFMVIIIRIFKYLSYILLGLL